MNLRHSMHYVMKSRPHRAPWTALLGALLVACFTFYPAAPMDAQRRALLDHADAERACGVARG